MPRICLTIPNKTPQPYRFPTDTEVVTIGRSAANDVVVEHGSISSHHCEMKRVKGGFILQDLSSTNGIHLDEDEMEVIDLKDGLDIEVGDVLFNYQLKEEETEELSEEKFKSQQKKKKKKAASKTRAANPGPAAPPLPNSAPAPKAAPTFVPSKNDGARDFAIFLACAMFALFALYLGMNSSHRASIPKDERVGHSLWSDMFPTGEESEKANKK